MHTDKNLLVKGIKYVSFTILLMFTAPVVMYQAFRNEEHPWFWPVAIAGMLLAIGAMEKTWEQSAQKVWAALKKLI